MPYKLLSEITDGFSDERIVGHGAFGVVYKVYMSICQQHICVFQHPFSNVITSKKESFLNNGCSLGRA